MVELAAMIDLRSDTATRPSPGMRAAIASADVGDEQKREDPTVTALQDRVAALLGHEAALFLPTATMANQIALKLHTRPGDVLHRGGALARPDLRVRRRGGARRTRHARPVAGVERPAHGRPGARGGASRARRSPTSASRSSRSRTRTTRRAAGCWPLEALDAAVRRGPRAGLAVHLDGARLLNAAVAQGVEPAAIAARFDTVTVCLSKGLGCPLGALLAGSAETIERAWREKHLFGGAMRQAGIVAAAGLYALDHNVERLADDHARARALAEAWAEAGLPIDLDQVQTNFVQIDVAQLGLGRDEALARMKEAGVGLSSTIHPTVVRAVTHLDVDDDEDRARRRARPACLGAARAGQLSTRSPAR